MPFQMIRNDITKVRADIIVNTANPKPVIGSGTDSAIYAVAGEGDLLAERQKIGNIDPGRAAVTPAFGLSAKYIIHTVGPAWTAIMGSRIYSVTAMQFAFAGSRTTSGEHCISIDCHRCLRIP